MMKLIIDISEEEYKEVLEDTYSGTPYENKIFTIIANGTPLPKGHGRLIDADELKEAMNEHTDYKGYLVCDPEEIIDLAPTVERPHGEWIKKYNADDPTTACSVCGFDTEDKVYFNFCPNCGADMRKEGEKR